MKVLVGVDGSPNSFAAVRFVVRLLSPERDELVLVYAAPDASLAGDEGLDETVASRARTALSQAVYEEAISRLPAEWHSKVVPPETVGDGGSASAALLRAARVHQADLIAVGFRGVSLFERFVLGSVSRAIVHSAPCPVLVVKSETKGGNRIEQPAGAASSPFLALAAYDGTPIGERVAALANRLAWPADSAGTVMTVVPPMSLAELPDWLQKKTRDPDVAAMADAWRLEHEQSVQGARKSLDVFREQMPACFSKRPSVVAEGSPAEKLIETLHVELYDLILIGGRSSSMIQQLLVGSTSSRVLAGAPCSVLLVR